MRLPTLKSWQLSIIHSAIAFYCLTLVVPYRVWWQIGICSFSFALCLYYVIEGMQSDRRTKAFKRRKQALEQIEVELGKVEPYEAMQLLNGLISPDYLREIIRQRLRNRN